MTQPLLHTALAALEDLRDHLHHSSNRAYFAERFVTAGDFRADEQTVRCAIQLVSQLSRQPAPPSEIEQHTAA